jgi:NAD(P)-dependent dehydrogenase (short-subunit alcohol dehydrogenase family)
VPDVVSVVVPVRNGERHLAAALDSILAQRGPALDVVVVDNASQDGSGKVAAAYADRGVRLLHHATPTGPGGSRNTGVAAARGEWLAFLDADDEWLRGIVELNLLVTMYCCQAEARAMVAAGTPGVIVNVSSGESTRPALRMAPYGAAKAGINSLTATLAVELGPHAIRVVAVAPGTTLTPVVRAALDDHTVEQLVAAHPLGRLTEPDDLARTIVAVASDLGGAITGSLVLGDNGAHLSRNRPAL